MKRESVTKELVFNAKDIIADGDMEPTQKAIIDRSFSTVALTLRE